MSDKLDFKAFDDGRADQLMREALTGHRIEPDPRLWKSISRKLLWKEFIHFNFTNLSPKYWMAGISGLLLVATTLYFGLHGSAPDQVSAKSNRIINPVFVSATNPIAHTSTGSTANPDHQIIESTVAPNPASHAQALEKNTLTGNEATQRKMTASQDVQTQPTRIVISEPLAMLESPGDRNSAKSTDIDLETASAISHISPFNATLLLMSREPDTIIVISNSNGILKFRKSSPGTTQFFSANLGITPELAFYSEPETYLKTNYWLNGGITYHISRFSFSSGFGLGYIYDEGKYKVEYKSSDSVGYYTGVTSYSVGANEEITYNTQTINVFDSLQHLTDYRTKNRYSYLQVPLLLGYRFFETNRVSLTFQVGPAVSFLLGSRKSDPVIEYRNARIIRVVDDTPARIHTNWQIWANLYFEMRMNKNVSLFLEPTFKYYLSPMVTQENVRYKAPFTIGLGVGIQFNFGQKKTNP